MKGEGKGNRTNHPKKPEAESRCRKITVSLTIEEDQLVRERAAAAGKTVTKYVADLVAEDLKRDQKRERRAQRKAAPEPQIEGQREITDVIEEAPTWHKDPDLARREKENREELPDGRTKIKVAPADYPTIP